MNDLALRDELEYRRAQLLGEANQERLASQARAFQRSAQPALRLQVAASLRALAHWVEPAPQAVACCPEPAGA